MAPDGALRILLVPSAYYPHAGGIEEMTRSLALELVRRGHAAMVLTNRWPAGTAAAESLDGITVRRVPFELPARSPRAILRFGHSAPRSLIEVSRLVRRFRPDLVHLMGAGPNAAYVATLAPLLGLPVVLSAHGEFRNDAHDAFGQSLALRLALRRLLRRAAAVTAPSQVVLDELRERMPVRAPALVIPNAVRAQDFARPSGDGAGGRPYLFTAGRLVHQKGIDLLLRAYARAADALAPRRLLIAGDGPERPALARLADELGLNGRVEFLGAVDRRRLAQLLCGADIFAFPSRAEAFGLALLEAMAAGVPAVATRVGGIPEFARDGENALLVAPEDPDALARALARLAAEPELAARIAAGGRAQADGHDWTRIGDRYLSLYASVIDG